MPALVFVDTNVFLYALDQGNVKKQQAAGLWREALWKSGRGRISYQVLQEFYAKALQKWPASRDDARDEVRDLMRWRPVSIDATILESGWTIQDRYQLSFWDALIVAAAKSANCEYLLTEDFQAGQNLDGIMIVSPFRTAVSSIT